MERQSTQRWGYLQRVIDIYTIPCGDVSHYAHLVKGLTSTQVEEIAVAYREMCGRGDARPFSEWVRAQSQPCREIEVFKLFGELARQGVAPFSDRDVEYSPYSISLDWSILPAELAYLREPAMKYGVYQFEEDRRRLETEISDAELADLAAVARRIRRAGEEQRIWDWRHGHEGRPEPDLVAWLVQVVNELVPRIPQNLDELDWRKLPSELDYLKEPAMKYGVYWLGVDRDRLVQSISDSELLQLAKLAARIRSTRDWAMVEEWLRRFPAKSDGDAEAKLVYFLLELLDEIVPEVS